MEGLENEGISIVTIVLNGNLLIEETILSVIKQDNIKIEYIIIDGGSTDGTLETIEKYINYITHIVSASDGGIYQAINKGISLASYPLVGLIHCGDSYVPNSLFTVYRIFKQTNADVIYGDIQFKEQLNDKYFLKTFVSDHSRLHLGMSIYHPSTFIKLNVYQEIGGYDFTYRSAADYDFLLKIFLQKRYFVHIPQVLAVFTYGGLSGSNFKLSLKENYRIRKNQIGLKSALLYTSRTSLIHVIYSFRRLIITSIIGKDNFNKLKSHWRTLNGSSVVTLKKLLY